ncbi:ribonuclease P protein component [Candidatus Fermentibacteria bacterium]|nr:MAG: ribonuclease P protein component [Candidatus Fermentibacteria bacterium]PIE52323.1 MAG: ribonuclease P protein component [Candidatus Fermentibacteria bacterium]
MPEDARAGSVSYPKLNHRTLKKLNRRWQFEKLFRKGGYFRGKVLKARYSRNSLGCLRLGFSVSAKKGNAVKRNLFRRRLKQYSVEKEQKTGFDAVILPTVKLDAVVYREMISDMEKLCLLVENGAEES